MTMLLARLNIGNGDSHLMTSNLIPRFRLNKQVKAKEKKGIAICIYKRRNGRLWHAQ